MNDSVSGVPAMPGAALSLLLLATVLLISACASQQRQDCESEDWDGLGYRDGKAGRSFDRIATLADRCSDYDLQIDSMAYRDGYARGIEVFCDPTKGFDRGERRDPYSGACPKTLEPDYLDSYVRGLVLARDSLQLDHDELRRQIDEERRLRSRLDPDEDTDSIDDRIDDLQARLETNLDERRDVNRTISKWSRRLD